MLDVASKYNVAFKTVYTRFRSTYGNSPSDFIKDALMPPHDELEKLILNTSSAKELREVIDLPHCMYSGIYDREFGVSTYRSAKLKILSSMSPVNYKPLREDNRSLWYSQLLGNGHYDRKRHAFRIDHGHKQAEYLKWKVSMINKAFPKTPSKISMHVHKQGHTYYSYYSRHIGNIDIPEDRSTVVNKLTPLGWLLWWLDDGYHSQNIVICCMDKKIVNVAIEELSSYGIKARSGQHGVYMCGKENDISFSKNFIEPFMNEIPVCMKYKVEDIVGGI
jgi:hypothetical protein